MSIFQPEPCPPSGAGLGSVAEFILCDSGNEGQRFIRKFIQDGTGSVTSVVDLDFEGSAYSVVGPVTACSTSTSAEVEVVNGAGDPIPVAGTVTLDAVTLAALETIFAVVSGEVSLDAATLAALETISISGLVTIQGDVAVVNFPAEYPLPVGQVTALTPQGDALTDAELRATPVETHAILRGVQPDSDVAVRDGEPEEAAKGLVVRQAGVVHVHLHDENDAPYDEENPLPVRSHLTDVNGDPFDDTNRLPVELGTTEINATFASIISTLNTTQTPLDANEVFIGEWEEVVDFAAITFAVRTDAGSAMDGAKAQFSVDGITVTTEGVSTIGPSGGAAYFTTPPQARYFRIHYTNGPVAQTTLDAEVTFRFNAPGVTQAPIAAPSDDRTVATAGKSFLHGRHSSGFWAALKTTIEGWLSVAVENIVTTKKDNYRVTGTLTAAAASGAVQTVWPATPATAVVMEVPGGHSSSVVELKGTFGPNSSVVFEQSESGLDGTWAATNMRRNNTPDVNESFSQIDNNPFGTNNTQVWKGTVGGIRYFRVRCAVLAPGDSIEVIIATSEGVGGTYLLGNPPSVSDYYTDGSLTAAGQTIVVRASGMGGWAAYMVGQFSGTVHFEASIDGINYTAINAAVQGVGSLQTSKVGTGLPNQSLQVRGAAGGLRFIRLRAGGDFAGTMTGTLRTGAGTSGVFMVAPVPIAGLSAGAQTNRVVVGTSAVRLDPSALSSRTTVEVRYQATGAANNGSIWVGFSNGVTSSNGRGLLPGEAWTLDVTTAVQLWAVASAAAQQVQVTEIG